MEKIVKNKYLKISKFDKGDYVFGINFGSMKKVPLYLSISVFNINVILEVPKNEKK